jgi:hypothetical protein
LTKSKTFKQRNAPFITAYVLLNIVVFLLVNGLFAEFQSGFSATEFLKLGKMAVVGIALNVISLVLGYVLPTGFKDVLVYWRVRNVLPGCRAFTKLAAGDPRINLKAIKRKLGRDLPTNAQEQNEVWYRFLKDYESQFPAIGEDHRMTLLFRDLTAVSFLLVPALEIPSFWFAAGAAPWLYLGGLVLMCLLLSLSGRNAGNRLVRNVLAQASLG